VTLGLDYLREAEALEAAAPVNSVGTIE